MEKAMYRAQGSKDIRASVPKGLRTQGTKDTKDQGIKMLKHTPDPNNAQLAVYFADRMPGLTGCCEAGQGSR